jgi:hypothetical protein
VSQLLDPPKVTKYLDEIRQILRRRMLYTTGDNNVVTRCVNDMLVGLFWPSKVWSNIRQCHSIKTSQDQNSRFLLCLRFIDELKTEQDVWEIITILLIKSDLTRQSLVLLQGRLTHFLSANSSVLGNMNQSYGAGDDYRSVRTQLVEVKRLLNVFEPAYYSTILPVYTKQSETVVDMALALQRHVDVMFTITSLNNLIVDTVLLGTYRKPIEPPTVLPEVNETTAVLSALRSVLESAVLDQSMKLLGSENLSNDNFSPLRHFKRMINQKNATTIQRASSVLTGTYALTDEYEVTSIAPPHPATWNLNDAVDYARQFVQAGFFAMNVSDPDDREGDDGTKLGEIKRWLEKLQTVKSSFVKEDKSQRKIDEIRVVRLRQESQYMKMQILKQAAELQSASSTNMTLNSVGVDKTKPSHSVGVQKDVVSSSMIDSTNVGVTTTPSHSVGVSEQTVLSSTVDSTNVGVSEQTVLNSVEDSMDVTGTGVSQEVSGHTVQTYSRKTKTVSSEGKVIFVEKIANHEESTVTSMMGQDRTILETVKLKHLTAQFASVEVELQDKWNAQIVVTKVRPVIRQIHTDMVEEFMWSANLHVSTQRFMQTKAQWTNTLCSGLGSHQCTCGAMVMRCDDQAAVQSAAVKTDTSRMGMPKIQTVGCAHYSSSQTVADGVPIPSHSCTRHKRIKMENRVLVGDILQLPFWLTTQLKDYRANRFCVACQRFHVKQPHVVGAVRYQDSKFTEFDSVTLFCEDTGKSAVILLHSGLDHSNTHGDAIDSEPTATQQRMLDRGSTEDQLVYVQQCAATERLGESYYQHPCQQQFNPSELDFDARLFCSSCGIFGHNTCKVEDMVTEAWEKNPPTEEEMNGWMNVLMQESTSRYGPEVRQFLQERENGVFAFGQGSGVFGEPQPAGGKSPQGGTGVKRKEPPSRKGKGKGKGKRRRRGKGKGGKGSAGGGKYLQSPPNVLVLSLLLVCMSSIVQPRGLPYDRGRRKSTNQKNLLVTSDSPQWLIDRYANAIHAEHDRFLSTSQIVEISNNSVTSTACAGYRKFFQVTDLTDTEILATIATMCGDVHVWSNYFLNNMTNLTPDLLTGYDLRNRVRASVVLPKQQRVELEGLGFVGFDFDGRPLPFPLKRKSTWCAEIFQLLPFHGPQGGYEESGVICSTEGQKYDQNFSEYDYVCDSDIATIVRSTMPEQDKLAELEVNLDEWITDPQQQSSLSQTPHCESAHSLCEDSVLHDVYDNDECGVSGEGWNQQESIGDLKGLQRALKQNPGVMTRPMIEHMVDSMYKPTPVVVGNATGVYPRVPPSNIIDETDYLSSPERKRYQRKFIPRSKKFVRGIPWPELEKGNRTTDGCTMAILDSGANISVVEEHLIPECQGIGMRINGFNNSGSQCTRTGELMGAARGYDGKLVNLNMGFGGSVQGKRKYNLLSVPAMLKLGYQFWLGDFPYLLTPSNQEIPLYVDSDSGFLGIRIHTVEDPEVQLDVNSMQVGSSAPQVGFVSNDCLLWHRRFHHTSMETLRYMNHHDLVVGMPKLRDYTSKKHQCISCVLGKSCQEHIGPINFSDVKTKLEVKAELDKGKAEHYPLEQVHVDTCYMDAPDLHGNTMFVVIVDRATMFTWAIPIKSTKKMHKVLEKFIMQVAEPYHRIKNKRMLEDLKKVKPGTEHEQKTQWMKLLSKHQVSGLRKVRCDRGSEFCNKEVREMLDHHLCELDEAAADVKDGRAEITIRKLCTFTRTCLIDAGLKKCFWSSIMDCVVHTINRTYSRRAACIPYSKLTGLRPNVSYFRQPGSIALYHIQDRYRQKLDKRAFVGIFIGYDTAHRSWVFLNPKTGRKVRTIHARFFERSRDSEEHINMGTLIFDRKKWVDKAVKSHHRCQLWPKVLWPGMDDDKLGNTSDEFPEPSKLEMVASDQMNNESIIQTETEKHGKMDQEDLAVQEHIDDDVDPPEVRTAEPSDRIVKGPKYHTLGSASYIKKRIDMILGKRVREVVLQHGTKFQVPTNTKFKLGNYKLSDLKYDMYAKEGQERYIKCIPSSEDMVDAAISGGQEVNVAERDDEENQSDDIDDVSSGDLEERNAHARVDQFLIRKEEKSTELCLELWKLVHDYTRKPWLATHATTRGFGGFVSYPTKHESSSEWEMLTTFEGRWKECRRVAKTIPELRVMTQSIYSTVVDEMTSTKFNQVGRYGKGLERVITLSKELGLNARHCTDTMKVHLTKNCGWESTFHMGSILQVCCSAAQQSRIAGELDASGRSRPCTVEPVDEIRKVKKVNRRKKPKRAIFFGENVEVGYQCNHRKFDQVYADGLSTEDMLAPTVQGAECTVTEWGAVQPGVPEHVSRMWVLNTDKEPEGTLITESFQVGDGFDEEGETIHISKRIDYKCDYGHMPDKEEFDCYQGNGTYVDSDGFVRPSYLVQNAQQVWKDSMRAAKADASRFILGVPSPSCLREKDDEDMMIDINVPKGSKAAMTQDKFYPMWPEAIYKEVNGLISMDCIELFPENDPRVLKVGVLPSHIVFTDKWTADVPPEFIKAKARVVAGGNFEEAPEKAFENFSPTAGPTINRFFDAYCVYRGYTMYSTDCSQAFLNSPTKRDIFVRPPPGLNMRGLVWRLKKHLYGLCSAPAAWMATLTKALEKLNFKAFGDDPCFLRRIDEDGDEIIVEVFVDDIKWGGKDPKKIKDVINKLSNYGKPNPPHSFAITFEDKLTTYLGMLYKHTKSVDGKHDVLTVNQTAYVETMITRFEMEDGMDIPSPIKHTPLPTFSHVEELQKKMESGLDGEGYKWLPAWAAKHTFPTIIGSLIHAMVHTRPDISLAVAVLSRGMSAPELWMWRAAHHLLCFLKHTKHVGLTYDQAAMLSHAERVERSNPTDTASRLVTAAYNEEESVLAEDGKRTPVDDWLSTKPADTHFDPDKVYYDKHLEASVDSSFADCIKTYRSTSGFVVWFGGSPIDWECKRQKLVTLSTMEAEYVAAAKCVCSIRFLKKLIDFVELEKGTTKVHEDNSACVAVSTKPVHRSRSKHIGTKYHVVREASSRGELELVQVWTEHQTADLFTKSLPRDKFERFQSTLLGKTTFLEMQTQFPKPHNIVNGVARCEQYQTSYAPESRKGGWVGFQVPKNQHFSGNMVEWRGCITKKSEFDMPGYESTSYSAPVTANHSSRTSNTVEVETLGACDEYAEHGLLYFVQENLLKAKEQYIAHQTPCRGEFMNPALGEQPKPAVYENISAEIARKYPHCDVFSMSEKQKSNICKPGSIYVSGQHTEKTCNDERPVITLYGQNYPGIIEQGSGLTQDPMLTSEKRQQWFVECLEKVALIKGLRSIAFPYRIGCGSAGGNWMWYQQQLEKLASRLPTVRVVVYMWSHTHFVKNADSEPEKHDDCYEDRGSSGVLDDDIDVNGGWIDNDDY